MSENWCISIIPDFVLISLGDLEDSSGSKSYSSESGRVPQSHLLHL